MGRSGGEIARPHGVGLWRKISMGKKDFLDCIQWKLRKDNIIRFWEGEWIGRGKLREQFPGIYALALRKNVVVEEVFRGVDGRSGWDMNLVRNLNDWKIDEFTRFIQLLTDAHLDDYKDKAVWKLKKDGIFTVKSFYHYLANNEGDSVRFPASQIWM